MPSKVWDEITYPFPNINGCTVEVWERIDDLISHVMDYSSIIRFKSIHVSKGGPCSAAHTIFEMIILFAREIVMHRKEASN